MESKETKHLETQNEVDSSAKAELDNVEAIEETTNTESLDGKSSDESEVVEEIITEVPDVVSEQKNEEQEPVIETVQDEAVSEPEPAEVAVPETDKPAETVATEPSAQNKAEEVSEKIEDKVEASEATELVAEVKPAENVEAEVKVETDKSEEANNEDESDDDESDDDESDDDDDSEAKNQESKDNDSSGQAVDYSTFTELELINEFRNVLDTKPFMEIYRNVDQIKINFYKKNKARVSQLKKEFVAKGGFEEEFKPEMNPYEQDLKNMLDEFRQLKTNHNREIEAEKDHNVQIKYEIIEEIKSLVNRKESINKTFQEFKELQQKWRDTGLVPQANMKDLWENYHHHVENFYDYIKINKELRDLDLKKNLEEKLNLCDKAEELLMEPSVIKAFNSLQKMHDSWREIGPVPRDNKDDLWERFKEATTKINKKHQDFFENRKKAQKNNLDAKTALCEKVEEILATATLETHKDWEEKSKELVELQKYWRTIGFTPRKENNIIYERFRVACDGFFDRKREFYTKHKEEQSNNLQMKIDLCVQAEGLKENTDWKKTTDEFIAIQKKWKEIGPIPRKHSDLIWKRFRAACDFFFENKASFFNSKDETQIENLKLKKELIEEVKAFKAGKNEESDFEKLRDFQRRWTEIGHVPINDKNDVQKEFRDAINVLFDSLSVEDKERNLIRFKNKMSDWKSSGRGHNKMFAERDKYVSKLKQIESDLITLKNNIGFFANSKNAEALIKDVEQKIQNNEDQIVYLKEKIRVIDDVEYNEE
ncbi:MAG: DUF349 domain-containing protein [Prolixibacteraceae bacterium]